MQIQSTTHRHRPSDRMWDIVVGPDFAGCQPGYGGTRRTTASVITDLCSCGAERHVWIGNLARKHTAHWIGDGNSEEETC